MKIKTVRVPVGRAGWGWALAGLLTLSACGGGGGGDGGGSPPPAAPAPSPAPVPTLSADAYPLASGDRRSWRVTEAGQVSIRHERVGEASGTALVVRDLTLRSFGTDALRPDSETLLQRSATGISELPGNTADALGRALGAVELLRFGLPLGQRQRLVERNVIADVDGDGRQDAVELRIDSEFVAVESVSTPAGGFADAQRVRSVVQISVRAAGATVPLVLEQTSDDWYAIGVGPVRRSVSSRVGSAPPELSTEELLAYRVGSRRNEQAAPTLRSSLPASGSFSRPDVQIELQFSRAIDPLSLIGDGGLRVLRDGQPVMLSYVQMVEDALSAKLFIAGYPLPDGQYEVRQGGQATDWSGNSLPESLLRFTVDTNGPRLISSLPVNGATEAARNGRIEFRFNEALQRVGSGPVNIVLRAEAGREEWLLPASIDGNTVSAELPAELRINSEYTAFIGGSLTDAQGNPSALADIRFRTDSGPFARPESWWAGGADVVLAVADLNADGRPDLLGYGEQIGSGNQQLVLRLQRGGGGFEPLQALHTQVSHLCRKAIAVADFNGDGRLDIVIPATCGPNTELTLLLQRAGGTYEVERVPMLNPSGYWLGRAIRLAGGANALVWQGSAGMELWRREGEGDWRRAVLLQGADSGSMAEVGDWDGDGREDLIWLPPNAANNGADIAWSLQAADGTWGAVRSIASPLLFGYGLLMADLNRDGRQDLAVSGEAPGGQHLVLVFQQDASGGLALLQRAEHPDQPGGMAAGDLNGDGRADLVVAERNRRTGVHLQAADGSFEPLRRFEAGFGAVSGVKPLALLDLNGDGRLDILQGSVVLYGRPIEGSWPRGLSANPTTEQKSRLLRTFTPLGAQP